MTCETLFLKISFELQISRWENVGLLQNYLKNFEGFIAVLITLISSDGFVNSLPISMYIITIYC